MSTIRFVRMLIVLPFIVLCSEPPKSSLPDESKKKSGDKSELPESEKEPDDKSVLPQAELVYDNLWTAEAVHAGGDKFYVLGIDYDYYHSTLGEGRFDDAVAAHEFVCPDNLPPVDFYNDDYVGIYPRPPGVALIFSERDEDDRVQPARLVIYSQDWSYEAHLSVPPSLELAGAMALVAGDDENIFALYRDDERSLTHIVEHRDCELRFHYSVKIGSSDSQSGGLVNPHVHDGMIYLGGEREIYALPLLAWDSLALEPQPMGLDLLDEHEFSKGQISELQDGSLYVHRDEEFIEIDLATQDESVIFTAPKGVDNYQVRAVAGGVVWIEGYSLFAQAIGGETRLIWRADEREDDEDEGADWKDVYGDRLSLFEWRWGSPNVYLQFSDSWDEGGENIIRVELDLKE